MKRIIKFISFSFVFVVIVLLFVFPCSALEDVALTSSVSEQVTTSISTTEPVNSNTEELGIKLDRITFLLAFILVIAIAIVVCYLLYRCVSYFII